LSQAKTVKRSYKALIEKAERAAADHRFILGALNAHMAKAKAKKADKKVEGTVKVMWFGRLCPVCTLTFLLHQELSDQHELEQKRLEEEETAARQDVAGRVSNADQTLRSSVSAWRDRVSNDSTNPSANSSDFGWTWESIDTINPQEG
jgi:DNA repair exonuclease SbcCD ATPase subunit